MACVKNSLATNKHIHGLKTIPYDGLMELSTQQACFAPTSGFAPIVGPGARVLILGSLPGLASLHANQYYAHPRNAFWPIMSALCHFSADSAYNERCDKLLAAGMAVWDICHSAQRSGSLDSAIQPSSVIANNIEQLVNAYSSIQLIAFNGNAAATLFKRHIQHKPAVSTVTLPSTSPANASMPFQQKLQRWSTALQ